MNLDSRQKIIVLSQNIRSMNTGFKKLEMFIDNLKDEELPDIIHCQETFKVEGTFHLERYQTPIYRTREKKKGGGIITFIKSNVRYRKISTPFMEDHFESLGIEIINGEERICFVNLYRPPKGNLGLFLDTLREVINKTPGIIVMGDMNIDCRKTIPAQRRLSNLLLNEGYHQIITEFTRLGQRPSLIDHVYTPISSNDYKTRTCENGISDHCGLVLYINKPYHAPKITENRRFFSYKKENISCVKQDIQKINWSRTLSDLNVEEATSFFEDVLATSVKTHCEKRIGRKNHLYWLPRPLFNLKGRVQEKLTRWKKDMDNDEKRQSYLRIKKRFDLELKVALAKREEILLQEKDSRKLWANIRKITHTNKSKSEKICISGQEEESEEALAEYFSNIANNIRSNLPDVQGDALCHNIQQIGRFKFNSVHRHDVWKIIKHLAPKRSHGHDRISSKLLKLVGYEILRPVTIIINKMISEQKYPTTWKKANVIPLHKGGDAEVPNNYRPISLLPCVSKLAEKVMVKQINTYFESRNLYPDTQFGFRSKKSTEQALNMLVNEVEKLKKLNKNYALIFLDFSKAFDLLDHDILLRKLKRFGFQRKALNLLQSYLSNRSIHVTCNGKKSKERVLSVGAPQGSCLGPILYLIYTSEISNLLKKEEKILFADDTAIIVEIDQNKEKGKQQIKRVLKKVWNHFTLNKLKLNIKKTVVLSTNVEDTINIQNESIRIENKTFNTKYLGIQLNASLDWTKQLDQAIKKAKFGIVQMYRIKTKNEQIRKKLFNTMVLPHLTYGLTAWGHTLTRKQKENIQRIIKIGVRCISGKKKYFHTEPLMKKLGILKFDDVIKVQVANQYLALKEKDNKNNALQKYWHWIETTTRAKQKIHPKFKTKTLQAQGQVINNLLPKMKMHLKRKGIIRSIKKEMIDSYKDKCDKKNCFICELNR